MVLNAGGVKGLVIRPGCVYGKQGKLTSIWFQAAHSDKALEIVGHGNNRWTMVHVDDLAEGYLKVAESGLYGEIFNLNDPSRWTVNEMVNAAARASGYSGDTRHVPLDTASRNIGDFAECLALDQNVDSSKAMRILKWQPRHKGFVDEITTYFESWKAYQT
jgi:nucleoside-diphosphate-sugar epimerase